ncbi:MAG: hypothetical protein KDA83_18610 [Planctomycetales bacterium]|nr:hypothetical protein [Planctomycetales bacterium]
MEQDSDNPFSDAEILKWVASGDAGDLNRAVTTLVSDPRLMGSIRRRVWQKLEDKQMLDERQPFYRADAVNDALAWIFERVLSVQSLRRTLLERGSDERGVGFDPTRGPLRNWLLNAAGFQLYDWIRKHRRLNLERTSLMDDAMMQPTSDAMPLDTEESKQQIMHLVRGELRGLPPMQRACMTVKYLWSESLDDQDLMVISTERGNRSPSNEDLAELRHELQTVGSSNDRRRKELNILVTKRFNEKRLEEKSLRSVAQRLQAVGWPRSDIRRLEAIASESTGEQFETQLVDADADVRTYLLSARRLAKLTRKWVKAQERARSAEASGEGWLPPRTIAAFLGKSVNAVSSALFHAHERLRGAADDDESDASEADDSL